MYITAAMRHKTMAKGLANLLVPLVGAVGDTVAEFVPLVVD